MITVPPYDNLITPVHVAIAFVITVILVCVARRVVKPFDPDQSIWHIMASFVLIICHASMSAIVLLFWIFMVFNLVMAPY